MPNGGKLAKILRDFGKKATGPLPRLFFTRIMARHSHWANIKRKKALVDAGRGKVFTKHAKLIEIAARDGGSGDPGLNSRLAMAVESAKADGVPKENIDRAIKKGIGAGGGERMEERIYEGYAPGGVGLLILTLTDNPTRTVANVRHALSKFGGKYAETGSVSFQFQRVGLIRAELGSLAADDAELAAAEAGADDAEIAEDELIVWTKPNELAAVRGRLAEQKITVKAAELTFRPVNLVEISDPATVEAIEHLISKIEEDDDVSEVISNADFGAAE